MSRLQLRHVLGKMWICQPALTTLGKRQVDPVEDDKSSTSSCQKPDNLSSGLRLQMFAVLDITGELKRRFADTQPLLLGCDCEP